MKVLLATETLAAQAKAVGKREKEKWKNRWRDQQGTKERKEQKAMAKKERKRQNRQAHRLHKHAPSEFAQDQSVKLNLQRKSTGVTG